MKKIIAVGCMALSLTGCWTSQQGQKVGLITKISKEGTLWGTWEGELIRGGFSDGTGANGQSFHFTFGQFKGKNVMRAMELMNHNKTVIIIYHCDLFKAPWSGETKCFLDNIEAHK